MATLEEINELIELEEILASARPEKATWGDVAKSFVPVAAKSTGAGIGGAAQLVEEINPASIAASPAYLMGMATSPLRHLGAEEIPESFRKIGKGIESSFPETVQNISLKGLEGLLGRDRTFGEEAYQYWNRETAESMPDVNPGSAKSNVLGILQNITMNAPPMAAAFFTKKPMVGLAPMGVVSGGLQYGDIRENRPDISSGEALAGGVASGATEILTEKIPLEQMIKPGYSLGKRIFLTSLADIPGEEAATTIQDGIIAKATTNPDMTWGDFVQSLKDTAIQSAGASLIQGSAAHGVVEWANRQQAKMAEEKKAPPVQPPPTQPPPGQAPPETPSGQPPPGGQGFNTFSDFAGAYQEGASYEDLKGKRDEYSKRPDADPNVLSDVDTFLNELKAEQPSGIDEKISELKAIREANGITDEDLITSAGQLMTQFPNEKDKVKSAFPDIPFTLNDALKKSETVTPFTEESDALNKSIIENLPALKANDKEVDNGPLQTETEVKAQPPEVISPTAEKVKTNHPVYGQRELDVIQEYGGHYITRTDGGQIAVVSKDGSTVFFPALDDSTMNHKWLEEYNTVEAAREYLDWLNKVSEENKKALPKPEAKEEPAVEVKPEAKEPWRMSAEDVGKQWPNPEGDPSSRSPWMMPVGQWSAWEAGAFKTEAKEPSARQKEWHRGIVRDALAEGKPVPEEVLKDYPELQPKASGKVEAAGEVKEREYTYKSPLRPIWMGFSKVIGQDYTQIDANTFTTKKPLSSAILEKLDLEALDKDHPANIKKRFNAFRSDMIDKLSEGATEIKLDDGTTLIYSDNMDVSTNRENPYRITRLLKDGTPAGHDIFKNFDEVAMYLWGDEKRIKSIRTSATQKPAPKKAEGEDEVTRDINNTAILDAKHTLKNPIKGKTGSEIIGYQWVSELQEGMYGDRRVSYWANAQTSEPTGRQIVHLYWVRDKFGNVQIMGVNAAQKALGISTNKLYSIAKAELANQKLMAEHYNELDAELLKTSPDTVVGAAREWRKRNNGLMEPDIVKRQRIIDDAFKKTSVITKNGRFVRTGDKELVANLKDRGWEEVPLDNEGIPVDSTKPAETTTPKPAPKVESATKPLAKEPISANAETKVIPVTKTAEKNVTTPKEQKKYLLEKIDEAIKTSSSDKSSLMVSEYSGYKEAKKKFGTVTIEVPNDGTFTIINTKERLEQFKKQANKLSTAAISGVPEPKTPIPSKKASGKRLELEDVTYYNEFKPRKKDIFGGGKNYYTGGYFTEGHYIVKTEKPAKIDIEEQDVGPKPEDIKRIIPSDNDLSPANIVAEYYTGEQDGTARAHIVSGSIEAAANAHQIDAILTKHPNATAYLNKEGTIIVFKVGNEFVGMTMALHKEFIPSAEFISETRGDAKFQRGKSTGLQQSQVQSIIDKAVSSIPNAPKVNVVQSNQNCPIEVQNIMEREGIDDAMGFTYNGEVYLVADNLRNEQEALRTLAHELTHSGLGKFFQRQTKGKLMPVRVKYEALMDSIYRAHSKEIEQLAKTTHTHLNTRTVQGRRQACEEWLCNQTYEAQPKWYDKLVAIFNDMLRAIGLDVKLSDAEVRVVLQDAFKEFGGEGVSFMTAWHGSPHDFNKFSKDKIGTGEGAQAYGYGLYFAGKREVAEYYKNTVSKLSKDRFVEDFKKILPDAPDNVPREIFAWLLADDTKKYAAKIAYNHNSDTREYIDKIGRNNIQSAAEEAYSNQRGRLYQVELAPAEDEYLLWDKPLSEQSEKVKKIILNEFGTNFFNKRYGTLRLTNGGILGEKFYRSLGGDRVSSERLHSLGIRGIKYLDGSSRNTATFKITPPSQTVAGDWMVKSDDYNSNGVHFKTEQEAKAYIKEQQDKANYNYVIFDESDIEVTAKFNRKGLKDTAESVNTESVTKDKGTANIPAKTTPDEAVGGEASWYLTSNELPEIYHGGKSVIKGEIDPSKLQQRDYGFYGRGFYGAASPDYVKGYGGRITKRYISPEAKILNASLKPEDAPAGLVDAIKKDYYDNAIENTRKRGKEDALTYEVEQIGSNILSWNKAVDIYAERNGIDVIKYSDGEIVVKNPSVLSDKRTTAQIKRTELPNPSRPPEVGGQTNFQRQEKEAFEQASEPTPPEYDLGNLESKRKEIDDYVKRTRRSIELPEMVMLARDLLNGKFPLIRARLRSAFGNSAFGKFIPQGDGNILLKAGIFSDIKLASKTLAHEIGHLVDYLPQHLMTRGNILGRIASLHKYMKNYLEEFKGAPGLLTQEDRSRLQKEAREQIRAEEKPDEVIVEEIIREVPQYEISGVTPEIILDLMRGRIEGKIAPELYEYLQRAETKEKKQIVLQALKQIVDERVAQFGTKKQVGTETVRETVERVIPGVKYDQQTIYKRFKELLQKEINKRVLYRKEVITGELKKLTKLWTPFDDSVDSSYRKYRWSSVELYADAFSVFINYPELMQKEAPTFYKAFLSWIESKPEVKETYDAYQKLANDREAVLERREKYFYETQKNDAQLRQEAEDLEKAEKKISFRSVLRELYRGLIDRNVALMEAVDKLKKAGKTAAADSLEYFKEERNYLSAEADAYLEEVKHLIIDPLKKAGFTEEDLGYLKFLMSTATIRRDVANPGGMGGYFSDEQIEHLKTKLGDERFNSLKDILEKFSDLREQYIIPKLEESGMYSDALMNTIKNARYYATFNVTAYMDKMYGAHAGSALGKIYHVIGTFQDIQNPFIATVMKDISLMRAAEITQYKKELHKTFSENDELKDQIQPAEKEFTGKGQTFVEPKDPKMGMVTYLKNGKLEAFYITKEIAEDFQNKPVEAMHVLRLFNALMMPIKAMLVNRNPIWMTGNVFRDYMTTAQNIPGATATNLLPYYRKAFVEAWQEVMQGKKTDVVQAMKRGKMLVIDRQYSLDETSDDTEFDKLYSKFGHHSEKQRNAIIEPFVKAWDFLGDLGKVSERAGKIAGYRWMKENTNMTEREIGHVVRSRIGTPDVYRRGAWQLLTNNMFLYSNVGKEGFRSSLESFQDDKAAYAWKLVKYNFLPKAVLALAALGAFGDDAEDIIKRISNYDKANYLVVPLNKTPEGRAVYLRMPQSYMGQFFGAIAWDIFNLEFKKATESVASMQPYSFNPVIKSVLNWGLYAMDTNPQDWYRGQNVVNRKEWDAGEPYRLIEMSKHTWNSVGGGLMYKFNKGQDPKGVWEQISSLPGMNVLGRFLKESNQGLKEEYYEASKEAKRDTALKSMSKDERIAKRERIQRQMRDAKSLYKKGYIDYKSYQERMGNLNQALTN